jgi:MFS family permease
MLQPAVGLISDHRPQPYSLAAGMGATLIGLVLLASPASYPMLILAAALVGSGWAVFHPEASRVARLASGGRHGLAQSLFQVGGNIGSSLGPILRKGVYGNKARARPAALCIWASAPAVSKTGRNPILYQIHKAAGPDSIGNFAPGARSRIRSTE